MKHDLAKLMTGLIICGFAVGIFGATLMRAVFYAPQQELAPSELAKKGIIPSSTVALAESGFFSAGAAATSSYPARLRIPSLNIDAPVQYTGITLAGNMGTPSNFTDVAWYKYGTVPGDVGSAVIDGHVDNGLSLAGVFKHLPDIQPAADIYITERSGNELHFVVKDISSYDYRSAPTSLIFGEHDARLLRLITCEGAWMPNDRTYKQRLVVTAMLQ